MNNPARLLLAAFLLCTISPILNAQAQKDKSNKETPNKTKANKGTEPDPMAVERRNTAVSLLTSLADDARAFRDQKVRARVLARTADALWTTEPDRARELFRR